MTYVDILNWAKKGIAAEISRQEQMLNDAQKYDSPTAPALRALLTRNMNDLDAQLDHVNSLLEDPPMHWR